MNSIYNWNIAKKAQRPHQGIEYFDSFNANIQSRISNKLWNLGQASALFCLAKSKNYLEQLWQIQVTT